ncbi:hypothetical protein LTS18_010329 [Coniosporium uncinatum]|uniref:Uncharacterized protein n=1 Tax=Coniosporium uncinatum TaxID=93489 RepID=A0ACC3CZK7_9PEZI|nr:hypothetical protein LTS18_010329 [Coniosporium uncinatum]
MVDDILRYDLYHDDEISDAVVQQASELFSEHYGVWSKQAPGKMGGRVRAGARVRLSPTLLRTECLPHPSPGVLKTTLFRAVLPNNQPIAHLCATSWHATLPCACAGSDPPRPFRVCWVTQLVVHSAYRRRGIASSLLGRLRADVEVQDADSGYGKPRLYGILSSHPASVMAFARVFGQGIEGVDGGRLESGEWIMCESPVRYVREGWRKVRAGVGSVDTGFWVDHAEVEKVLGEVRRERGWPLGELVEGCEFLLIMSGDSGAVR